MRRVKPTFWGSTAVGIDRLAMYKEADVICPLRNSTDMNADGNAAVAGHAVCPRRALSAVPAVWFYGATLSHDALCHAS